jgi:signal peptidase I
MWSPSIHRRADSVKCGVPHSASESCPEPTQGLSRQTFVKRIVATPGDQLSIRDGLPIVNGKPYLAQTIRKCSKRDAQELCELPKPITIPPGHYFVIGDHSGGSFDSRLWGPIPQKAILGRVELP